MESRKLLISADRLIRDIDADPYRTESEKSYDRCLVHRQPIVDAVEVVRCQNCTYRKRHTKVDELYGACSLIGCTKHENGFCDCGERKET